VAVLADQHRIDDQGTGGRASSSSATLCNCARTTSTGCTNTPCTPRVSCAVSSLSTVWP
jgi:hypothetical protein